ncbi:hypothetical protein [Microbulbifer sp. JMSA003]|uniref:hypothetical protein n=1 Tax=Microbulbifer sp. JMSA003 TaxID=3243369 RepID=UPI00403A3FA4
MKQIFLFAFFSAVLWVSSASAASDVFLCDNCTSFSGAADANLINASPRSKFYIADLKSGVIKAYMPVLIDPTKFTPDNFRAQEVSVDSSVQTLFDKASGATYALYAGNDTATVNVRVPESTLGSAWGMSGSSANTKAVEDLIFDHLEGLDVLYAYESAVVQLIGKLVGLQAVANVVFADGSTALFKISGAQRDGTLTFSYVPGSAYDENGNKIPDNLNQFSGTYEMSPKMFEDFRDAIERWGGNFDMLQNCEGGETICEVHGNDLHCVYFPGSCD